MGRVKGNRTAKLGVVITQKPEGIRKWRSNQNPETEKLFGENHQIGTAAFVN